MFVPSLSWENDRFVYKWRKKTVFAHHLLASGARVEHGVLLLNALQHPHQKQKNKRTENNSQQMRFY